jgi:tRNA-2-methylthio-N6-dimethylallyladenosine synthase
VKGNVGAPTSQGILIKESTNRKFYLETYGCQMNVHDSEKVSSALAEAGYESILDPSSADLILLNTCMVREKAANKVYTRLGELKHLTSGRRNGAKPVFAVMGCVAQAEADRIFDKCADVRLVLGTQSIARMASLLEELDSGFPRAIDVRLSKEADFFEIGPQSRTTPHIAYITITEGCNKFCSFCVVPFTRGRERSRPAVRILKEAQGLAAHGYKEVHLLGQNVNSYGLSGRIHGNQIEESLRSTGDATFVELLQLMARESGIPRIKFTTSYPRDFDGAVVKVIDDYPNLCEWIHLPAQSGSNRLLRAMRRGYTREEYQQKIELIRQARKDISITGDIIVGFPGETEADFDETMSLVSETEYDGLYIFKYSSRPHTAAQALSDSVPERVKTERFVRLQELQDEKQRGRYSRYLGREVEVLVEGTSSRSEMDYTGHTRCNKVINFPKAGANLGEVIKVKVTGLRTHSLYGEVARSSV